MKRGHTQDRYRRPFKKHMDLMNEEDLGRFVIKRAVTGEKKKIRWINV